MKTRSLAYSIEGRRVADTHTVRPHAVAQCASCEVEYAITVPRDGHNPEAIGERFRRLGFEFNPFKRASVRCPACIARSRTVRRANAPADLSSNTVIPMTQRTPPTLGLVTSPPGGASPPTVTGEQRSKVRELLTGTFDEQRGHYLDHYSDQRIATECAVPMQVVREMREMWLGPIKSVPELEGLAVEIANLQTKAQGVYEATQALKMRLEGELQRLGVTP